MADIVRPPVPFARFIIESRAVHVDTAAGVVMRDVLAIIPVISYDVNEVRTPEPLLVSEPIKPELVRPTPRRPIMMATRPEFMEPMPPQSRVVRRIRTSRAKTSKPSSSKFVVEGMSSRTMHGSLDDFRKAKLGIVLNSPVFESKSDKEIANNVVGWIRGEYGNEFEKIVAGMLRARFQISSDNCCPVNVRLRSTNSNRTLSLSFRCFPDRD